MAFWRLYYHLVWATKDRQPLITPELELHLYEYLSKKANELEVGVYACNGYVEHVHLVVTIPPKYAVADVVKHLKGASSYYINHTLGFGGSFAWQRGYGALTVGERQKHIAIDYVEQQKRHHAQASTYAWLERCDDLDDDPRDRTPSNTSTAWRLQEESTVYEAENESPF